MKIANNKRKPKKELVCENDYEKKDFFLNNEIALNRLNLAFHYKNAFEYLAEKNRQNDFFNIQLAFNNFKGSSIRDILNNKNSNRSSKNDLEMVILFSNAAN